MDLFLKDPGQKIIKMPIEFAITSYEGSESHLSHYVLCCFTNIKSYYFFQNYLRYERQKQKCSSQSPREGK